MTSFNKKNNLAIKLLNFKIYVILDILQKLCIAHY